MFDIMSIDPPWQVRKGGKRKARPNQGRELDYDTMTTPDIFRLLDDKVFPHANTTHTVFMWATEKFLTDCEYMMSRRDYKLHARLVWDKMNGVAPAFTLRYSHEYLLWYYKPRMLPISIDSRGKARSVFREKGREHSRKPDVAYSIIDSWYPSDVYKKIDVFSREKRPGWSQFGNQMSHFSKEIVL